MSLEQIYLRQAFVAPFYLPLLSTQIPLAEDKKPGFCAALVKAAQTVSDRELDQLLAVREWRARMTAAWFVGLTLRKAFVERIGELLIASEMTYSGRGYCVALGLIANDQCVRYLRSYLRKYLPLNGRYYDQELAIGALTSIEGNVPPEFLDLALWAGQGHSLNPQRGIQQFAETYSYLRDHHMIQPVPPEP
jgi:hypothetical protein